jgi:hypothetical protein
VPASLGETINTQHGDLPDLRIRKPAGAGIPHYWIIRMAGDDGLAVSLERLRLTVDQTYVSSGHALRDRDLTAPDHPARRRPRRSRADQGEEPHIRPRSLTNVIVYPLWHVHHFAEDEDGNVRHHDEDGDMSIDEEEGDNVKLLGIYSSRTNAEQRIAQARLLPGFRDEPDCFLTEGYELNRDKWSEGYITEVHE